MSDRVMDRIMARRAELYAASARDPDTKRRMLEIAEQCRKRARGRAEVLPKSRTKG